MKEETLGDKIMKKVKILSWLHLGLGLCIGLLIGALIW